MYSVLLATMLTAGGEAPSWGHHGWCHGCHGYYTTCWGYGCSGCFGCSGCYGGCYGCYGGCYGCYSPVVVTYPVYYGCYSGCYGCGGCFGCHSYGCYSSCFNCYSGPGYVLVPACTTSNAPRGGAQGGGGSGMGPGGQQGGGAGQKSKGKEQDPKKMKVIPKGGEVAAVESSVSTVPAPANITVRLPANAKLYVDNVLCTLSGAERSFSTSNLPPGRRFMYNLRVETSNNGEVVAANRRIYFSAGQSITVGFGSSEKQQTVSR